MTQNQTTNAGRITIIDALRGFALFGVIWVHFQQHFSYFSMGPFNEHTPILSQFNETVQWLTNNVMMGRFINIFAFLFGMSFFIQMDRAAKKGIDFRGRFLWRMVVLFVIGLISTAFYRGDILSVYAIYGVILLLLNPCKNWILTLLAALLLLGTPKLTSYAYDKITAPAPTEQVDGAPQMPRMPERRERPQGEPEKVTFLKVAKENLTSGSSQKINYQYKMSNRGYITLAIFFFGLIVGRLRFFETCHLHKRRNFALFALFLGGTVVAGWIATAIAPEPVPGMWFAPPSIQSIMTTAMNDLKMVFSSAAILMAFVILYNIPSIDKALNVLAPYGRMGLTNYVSQSIIGACLFAMWGFGATFGAWGATELMLLGVGLYIVQIIICSIWLRYFKFGPLEWLWRSATYMKWQPFLNK